MARMTRTIAARTITTVCSGCMADVTITIARDQIHTLGTATVKGHREPADVYGDADLFTWDCPACDHADSFDPNF